MAFYRAHILVDTGTPAVLKGAMAVKSALVDEIKKKGPRQGDQGRRDRRPGHPGRGPGDHRLSRGH